MPGPGWSAEQQYRTAVRRRRKIRWATALGAGVATAAGAWLLAHGYGPWAATGRSSALAGAAAVWASRFSWSAAGLAVILLAWPAYGGRDVGRWQRGAEGERRTGDLLRVLPAGRFVVRHDLRIPGSRANIDHVVISRTGVWVIDTKTTRAPVTARWRRVYFGDRRLDTASVRWEAEVVADRLAAGLDGCPASVDPDRVVRPVVAVHGSGLRRRGGRAGGVRVVAAGDLGRRLRRGRRRLSRSQVHALGAVLDRVFPGAAPTGAGIGARTGAATGAGRLLDEVAARGLRSWRSHV